MNIKKLVIASVILGMTSLFGATGGSDSDGGKKYNMAYIDCEADGNKKYIMDYLHMDGQGFDFTKTINKLKRADGNWKCKISGLLEIPKNYTDNLADLKHNLPNGWPIGTGSKNINRRLTYGITLEGS